MPEGTTPDIQDKVFEAFLPYYRDNCNIKTKPFDGITGILNTLRENGVKLAVVSNKPDASAQVCCREHFDGLFDYVTGQKPGAKVKPDPEVVQNVLHQFGISPERAVYIGDSEVDVLTGKNAGMHSIAVTWGFRDVELLKSQNPDFIANERHELLKLLTE